MTNRQKSIVLAFIIASASAAGCCGIQKKPVNDAANHIADTAAAGKAAVQKCAADKTNCDQVTQAFDLIGTDAAGLQKMSGGSQ